MKKTPPAPPAQQVSKQTTDQVMMIRPAAFGFNAQTAASNAFQTLDEDMAPAERSARARDEFDALVAKLRSVGIEVTVIEDTPTPVKPDAVFPNNWISLHENGKAMLYPMLTENRRIERRQDILLALKAQFGLTQVVDYSYAEAEGRILEGTGSLIMDRDHQLVYACISPRTDPGLLADFCKELDCTPVQFDAVDGNGQPIYHTNVMMALGETFVVICLATIRDAGQLAMLLKRFEATGKVVVEISLAQMNAFAGNMLQLRGKDDKRYLVMSTQAYDSLLPGQIELLQQHTHLLHSDIRTIETYGGGSARCMIAENFLPKKV